VAIVFSIISHKFHEFTQIQDKDLGKFHK